MLTWIPGIRCNICIRFQFHSATEPIQMTDFSEMNKQIVEPLARDQLPINISRNRHISVIHPETSIQFRSSESRCGSKLSQWFYLHAIWRWHRLIATELQRISMDLFRVHISPKLVDSSFHGSSLCIKKTQRSHTVPAALLMNQLSSPPRFVLNSKLSFRFI